MTSFSLTPIKSSMFIVFVHRCLARYVCFRNFLFSFSVCSPVVLCRYRFWRWCGNCFLDWNHVFMWSSKSLEKYWNSHTEKCFWNSKGCFSNFYSYFYLRLSNQWLFRVLLVGQHFNHSDTWNFSPCRCACGIFEACILSRACRSFHVWFYWSIFV